MKINEKNLCAYAVSETPVDKEGYLSKKGDVNKIFQKRYFVLKGNLLFYFDKKGDKEPLGVIILEGCTLEVEDDEEQFCFKIDFHGSNNRSYVLGADSQESMEQWMKALACSSYDYMKLMVAELQRQLDDIDDSTIGFRQRTDSPKPPPRHRFNPFNKVENTLTKETNNCNKSTELVKEENSSNNEAGSSQIRISFKELHSSYGRQIIMDFTSWKGERKIMCQYQRKENDLISF